MYTTTATLSDTKQVILPTELVEKLELEPGTKFFVMSSGDNITLKIAYDAKRKDFWDSMDREQAWAKKVGMTEDDITEAIKQVRAKNK